MKQMNFTTKEVLKALLDKTKTTTIRKAWKEMIITEEQDIGEATPTIIDKPCKYKVGEIREVVWKKESKEEYFCKRHGNNIITKFSNIEKDFKIDEYSARNFRFGRECGCTPPAIYDNMERELFDSLFFNKNLGKVKITKVFEIEMGEDSRYATSDKVKESPINYWMKYRDDVMRDYLLPQFDNHKLEKLSKEDGFNSAEEMFAYLNKNYDLRTPKKFYVYRYRWLK